jgi:hypothetical protein
VRVLVAGHEGGPIGTVFVAHSTQRSATVSRDVGSFLGGCPGPEPEPMPAPSIAIRSGCAENPKRFDAMADMAALSSDLQTNLHHQVTCDIHRFGGSHEQRRLSRQSDSCSRLHTIRSRCMASRTSAAGLQSHTDSMSSPMMSADTHILANGPTSQNLWG